MTPSTIAALLAEGVAHHQAGRLADAERHYRHVLNAAPTHAAALNLLGVLALQVRQPEPALDLADAAIRAQPRTADFHANRGHALKALGRMDEAICSYRESCRLAPAASDGHYNLANALMAHGRTSEAVGAYQRALAIDPSFADALNNLGNAQRELGRFAAAADSFEAAARLQPGNGMLHFNLAAAQESAGDAELAIASYLTAARLAPGLAADAQHAAAGLLRTAGRPDEAIAALQAAIRIRPDEMALHNSISFPLTDCDRLQEAEQHLRRANSLAPNDPAPLTNLGNLLRNTGHSDEAVACFDEVLRLRPGYAAAAYGRATAHLLERRFAAGWEDYEFRFEALYGRARFDTAPWAGEDLAQRTLLLHAEQGFGDTIQFSRYVPMAAARGRVVLQVQRPLVRLLAMLPGPVAVIADGEDMPPFDEHCPLMSLARAFGTVAETIPAEIPYLHADPAEAVRWHSRLAAVPGLKVGLVWQGLYRFADDRLRSLPVAILDGLNGVPGVSFISLQKGEAVVPAFIAHDWTAELANFADTAALISALDLVIAVDTAVAHLAGALGKPVWLMNRDKTDWRWQRGRADSPWYPTLRIFRQPHPGDWRSVIDAVRVALEQTART